MNHVGASAPSRLEVFERTGELDTAYQPHGLPRFRVNAFRQRGEISLAFRVIPHTVPGFKSLRLPPGVETLADEHRGLILVTGATGVGKTTTLAAMVGHINRTRRQHIVTIEDPIEFLHDDEQSIVNQREVGIDTESFEEGLRRVLRQDPDVILIGELRDRESAETALQAAESGHLVLSTMHTVDAAETLGRLVEFFPAEKQPQVRSILAGVLKGVISQRLLPRTDGGRIAAVEVMVANARIQELIRENKPEFVPEAIAEGAFFQMQTLTKALIDLVVSGDVDQETAAAAAPNRHDFMIALDRALKEHAVQESEEPAKDAEPEEPAVHDGARAAPGQRPPHRLMRARLQVRRAAAAQDGFTLPEMLVVLAIVGVVLAGITQLFMSAMKSQSDQTNRTQAQQDARLGLDKLRREIRCASALTTPSGYPASTITITLGSYCPTAGGAATTVTWCTKDKNGASPPVAGAQPYTLWRYTGSACSGTGTKWASESRGQDRRTEHLRRQDLRRRLRSGRRRSRRRRRAGPWPRGPTPTTSRRCSPAAQRFRGRSRRSRSPPG